MATAAALERTPLYECHVEAGARLVEFAGWEMPVQYAGVIEEHRAVRTAAGLFDVSHMGEIVVSGASAEAFVARMTPNDPTVLRPGRAQYSALLTDEGTYIDDLLVYRRGEDFLLVVNAVNREADLDWLLRHAAAGVEVRDESAAIALLALQGPAAEGVLRRVAAADVAGLRSYAFVAAEVCGVRCTVSRTGYTGEDGFEIYVSAGAAAELWRALIERGREDGLVPCGLGARDTLRIEAGLALYGHEIDRATNPWEARLGWTCKLDRGDFVGREALLAAREKGVSRHLVGLELSGRRIGRQGAVVRRAGREIGVVTSGTWSPTLERPIAIAMVEAETAAGADGVEVEIRGRGEPATVTRLPFYRRADAGAPAS
ncbi:MAG: glycine cleavage system aminomethyltransferase GcvT [Thermoanaerobaculia bacterium]|nr:glycine cleavage system aminomethyltransferase GcvT [Thermoanaerobaculia bacterium]